MEKVGQRKSFLADAIFDEKVEHALDAGGIRFLKGGVTGDVSQWEHG